MARGLPERVRFRDSCNVYAVHGPEGSLLVDAGTGLWLDRLGELPAEPVALACTHFFRDHSAGAVRAAKHGIPIFGAGNRQKTGTTPSPRLAGARVGAPRACGRGQHRRRTGQPLPRRPHRVDSSTAARLWEQVLVPRMVQRPARTAGRLRISLPLADTHPRRPACATRRPRRVGGNLVPRHTVSGHTRFSAAIAFEADGICFAHTGDQYHFNAFFDSCGLELAQNWAEDEVSANHVYRNGAFLDSFARSASWLREWRPDVVVSGHQPAMWTNDAFFDRVDEWTQAYERMHRESMVLGDDDVHFGLDSWGGWIRPYRSHVSVFRPVTITATVRNPFPATAILDMELVGPRGWHGSSARMEAGARAEVSCELSITPNAQCRRQPIAVELTANEVPFGQVAEALVTVGGAEF
jgi:hypothetical protein